MFKKFVKQYIRDLIELGTYDYKITDEEIDEIADQIANEDEVWNLLDSYIYESLEDYKVGSLEESTGLFGMVKGKLNEGCSKKEAKKNLKEASSKKQTYKVWIEETVSDVFEVEAEDEGEAAEIAEENYWNGEFVLEPGEVTNRQMMVEGPDGEQTSWNEF